MIRSIKGNSEVIENITYWHTLSAQPAKFFPFPPFLDESLRRKLNDLGIASFYSHQSETIQLIHGGRNVVITTGTASGKSLCYQVPILDSLVKGLDTRALLIFPTKALTYDQLESFSALIPSERKNDLRVAVYDGDTPQRERQNIRKQAKIILSNPDMLNIGILPHHTIWENFFKNLKYIVLDEIHIYRGIFGSHVANLIRRLTRISDFYGAKPQFIMTSATINNPLEHGMNLIEADLDLIDEDGSPRGDRSFVFYNPPLLNTELGIREGLMISTEKFLSLLFLNKLQTIVFCRTRRFVEILLREIQVNFYEIKDKIRGYRSGYLKSERREIEAGLKSGEVLFAIATNALELGVDIGGIDTVVLPGYPGTISAFVQRAGRAGRKGSPSLAIFIASMNPLDQYLVRHPDYLLSQNTENALIDADNPLILLSHLQCAASELPFSSPLTYGKIPQELLKQYLDYLTSQGILHEKIGNYFLTTTDYPARNISLRSTSLSTILLQFHENGETRSIGEVDCESGLWMVHPGAVYIHNGETYLVDDLDLERKKATLSLHHADYITEPIQSMEIEIKLIKDELEYNTYSKKRGEVLVSSTVTGFKRIKWPEREILAYDELELPETSLLTQGYWIVLKEECVRKMREAGLWISDRNDYGPDWKRIRDKVRTRDEYSCQVCGKRESISEHHVHHKVPFKRFQYVEDGNVLSNLVTLCKECHRLAESQVKVQSAISGLEYILKNLSPLLIMCDAADLGSNVDTQATFEGKKPAILFYDLFPAGVGLSYSLYNRFQELLQKGGDAINQCECASGCPSCVGPTLDESGDNKKLCLSLINLLLEM